MMAPFKDNLITILENRSMLYSGSVATRADLVRRTLCRVAEIEEGLEGSIEDGLFGLMHRVARVEKDERTTFRPSIAPL